MLIENPDFNSAEDTPVTQVRIWDIPTRIFHWMIVCLVMTSWITAENGFMKLHLWSGLTLLALLLFRVAWGIVGSTTARFSHFVTTPAKVFNYLRSLAKGEKPLHAGHNPAGGWMVMTLITILIIQASIGLFANNGLHFNGPLAAYVGEETSDRLTNLHGIVFNFILLLVWAHVVAAGFYFFVKDENLIKPMFTGKKPSDQVPAGLNLKFTHLFIALVLFAMSIVVVRVIVGW